MKALMLVWVLLAGQVSAEPVYLGVLEEPQTLPQVSARLLFVKEGNDWRSLAAESAFGDTTLAPNLDSIVWTVAFKGRSLGALLLEDKEPARLSINDWFYGRDKLFQVRTGQDIPRVPNTEGWFGGWMKVPASRPLALVSRPSFSDHDGWQPLIPDEAMRSLLYVPLRLVVGRFNAYRCPGGPYVNEPSPYDFKAEDTVIDEAYVSSRGSRLIAIGLDPEFFGCDDLVPPEWSANWFLLEEGNIDFLAREMTLVDAGDYDNNGQSELLFWHSGYNEDGYVLMYDSFRKKIEYFWSYH